MESAVSFRNYIMRITGRSILATFCLTAILAIIYSVLDSFVALAYGVQTNFLLNILLSVIGFSLAPVLATGITALASSLLVSGLIKLIIADSNQDRLIYLLAAFALIPLIVLLGFGTWYILFLFSGSATNIGRLAIFALPTTSIVLIMHYYASPQDLLFDAIDRKVKST